MGKELSGYYLTLELLQKLAANGRAFDPRAW